MSIPAYPLQWPAGWKRYPSHLRRNGKFTDAGQWITVYGALKRVRQELERMGVTDDDVVISTNIRLRMDGFPRSGEAPDDGEVGAAVYWFDTHGNTRCMAIDRYTNVADNIAAIAATLSAMRAIERHGGAEILDRAFTGFVALAGPEPWFTVLGVPANAARDVIEAAYLRLRSSTHPDKGGSAEAFRRVQEAYQQGINRA